MPEPTRRLYFDDPTLRAFSATVQALTTWQDRPAVILDATAFYPEGGGQPADRGSLGGIAVVDVQESADRIFHLLAAPLTVSSGATIEGMIDWTRRFDHMQQHTGQHTLSAAFWRLMGAATTSWHLGDAIVTIDIDRTDLAETDLRAAELAANAILWQDVPVTAAFYDQAALAALPLRKGTDRAGTVRIVQIGAWDAIGCGGTHVASSGQVGAISLRRAEPRGDLTRIEFVCGGRALADSAAKTAIVQDLVARLKVPPSEVVDGVARLQAQLSDARHEQDVLRGALLAYVARDLLAKTREHIGTAPLIVARLDDHDAAALRAIAQEITEAGAIALLGTTDGERAQLLCACPKDATHDMRRILKAALPHIEGKGGGQHHQAQGGGPTVAGLDAALAAARAELLATPSV